MTGSPTQPVDHEWLMKMLSHDIADRKFLETIEKFLKAGVMENGKYLVSERGTSQGNGASPILANIYLHFLQRFLILFGREPIIPGPVPGLLPDVTARKVPRLRLHMK